MKQKGLNGSGFSRMADREVPFYFAVTVSDKSFAQGFFF
jgi:hypothetical protein